MPFNIVDSVDTTNAVGSSNHSPVAASALIGIAGITGAGMLASLAPTTIIGLSLVTGSLYYAGHRK